MCSAKVFGSDYSAHNLKTLEVRIFSIHLNLVCSILLGFFFRSTTLHAPLVKFTGHITECGCRGVVHLKKYPAKYVSFEQKNKTLEFKYLQSYLIVIVELSIHFNIEYNIPDTENLNKISKKRKMNIVYLDRCIFNFFSISKTTKH